MTGTMRSWWSVALLLGVVGCGDSTTTDDRDAEIADSGDDAEVAREAVAGEFGSAGGMLALGRTVLTIPEGALSEPTEIRLVRVGDVPPGYRPFSPLYRIEPADLALAAAVTLEVPSTASTEDQWLATIFGSLSAGEGGGYARRGGLPTPVGMRIQSWSLGEFFVADGVDYRPTPNRTCTSMRELQSRTVAPSGVSLYAGLDDCWGRPIDDLSASEIVVIEDGEAIGTESVPTLSEVRTRQLFVTLAIDVSSSTRAIIDDVVDATQGFVETISADSRGIAGEVQLSVRAFAGEDETAFVLPHTLDLDAVRTSLEELRSYTPADDIAANLNGGTLEAIRATRLATDAYVARNGGGAFAAGHLVVFTDGADTAGREATTNVEEAVSFTSVEVIGIGLHGDSYDAEALRQIVGRPYEAESTDVLGREFAAAAAQIARLSTRNYLVGYCSTKREGTHRLLIGIDGAELQQARREDTRFASDGFAGGCSTDLFDPATSCGALECAGVGCGGCADETALCNTDTGTCESYCDLAAQCGDATYVNPLGYAQVCPDLPGERIGCEGGCVDPQTDLMHCGGCDVACAEGASCDEGACVCPPGQATVCDDLCVDLDSSEAYCGDCDTRCLPDQTCNGGTCECPSARPNICDGLCVDTSTDERFCGDCETSCAAHLVCTDGACGCPAATPTTCGPDLCVNTDSDTTHCGDCETVCRADELCGSGACACPAGELECGGACVTPASDVTNCGGCGIVCGPLQTCTAGTCRGPVEATTAITEPTPRNDGRFGLAVDISADGSRVVVLASTVAYIIDRSGMGWSVAHTLTDSDLGGLGFLLYSTEVALSHDGSLVFVEYGTSSFQKGFAVFDARDGTLVSSMPRPECRNLRFDTDRTGARLATYCERNGGATNNDVAVDRWDGISWVRELTVPQDSSSRFTKNIWLSASGDRLLTTQDDSAIEFSRTGTSWSLSSTLSAGEAVWRAYGADTVRRLLTREPYDVPGGPSQVWQLGLWEWSSTAYTRTNTLRVSLPASGDLLGLRNLVFTRDGTRVVTSRDTPARSAVIFAEGTGGGWYEEASLSLPDRLITDIAIDSSGSTIIMSYDAATIGTSSRAGAIYVFTRIGTAWSN